MSYGMKLGLAAMMLATPALAQNADALRAQLAGHEMNLRGYNELATERTGETVRLQIFDNGSARVRFSAFGEDEAQEGWMLWRVNARGQFCTTFAVPDGRGVLRADDDEDCLDIAVQGNSVGLNFYGSTGNLDRYSGTLRRM